MSLSTQQGNSCPVDTDSCLDTPRQLGLYFFTGSSALKRTRSIHAQSNIRRRMSHFTSCGPSALLGPSTHLLWSALPFICTFPATPLLSCTEGCNCIYLQKNPHMQGSNAVSNQLELICEASILGGSPPLITHQSLSPARCVPAPLLFPPHRN